MPDTPPLDATALAALRAKAERVIELGAEPWIPAASFSEDGYSGDVALFLAACSPKRILALLAAVERGAEEAWQLTRAKSALENYGRHHPWCQQTLIAGPDSPPCDCGLVQAIRDADPVNVANAVSGANADAARATPTGADHAE